MGACCSAPPITEEQRPQIEAIKKELAEKGLPIGDWMAYRCLTEAGYKENLLNQCEQMQNYQVRAVCVCVYLCVCLSACLSVYLDTFVPHQRAFSSSIIVSNFTSVLSPLPSHIGILTYTVLHTHLLSHLLTYIHIPPPHSPPPGTCKHGKNVTTTVPRV